MSNIQLPSLMALFFPPCRRGARLQLLCLAPTPTLDLDPDPKPTPNPRLNSSSPPAGVVPTFNSVRSGTSAISISSDSPMSRNLGGEHSIGSQRFGAPSVLTPEVITRHFLLWRSTTLARVLLPIEAHLALVPTSQGM